MDDYPSLKSSGVGHLEKQSGDGTRDCISQWSAYKGWPEDRDADASLPDGGE